MRPARNANYTVYQLLSSPARAFPASPQRAPNTGDGTHFPTNVVGPSYTLGERSRPRPGFRADHFPVTRHPCARTPTAAAPSFASASHPQKAGSRGWTEAVGNLARSVAAREFPSRAKTRRRLRRRTRDGALPQRWRPLR